MRDICAARLSDAPHNPSSLPHLERSEKSRAPARIAQAPTSSYQTSSDGPSPSLLRWIACARRARGLRWPIILFFISYARKTSRDHAEALHHELGGDTGLAFLDTSDIETLQKFPAEISEALLAAKVVVIFADETYFRRWYCLREFEPRADSVPQAGTQRERVKQKPGGALSHSRRAARKLNRIAGAETPPSEPRDHEWLRASDTKGLAEIVNARLRRSHQPSASTRHRDRSLEAQAVRRRFRSRARCRAAEPARAAAVPRSDSSLRSSKDSRAAPTTSGGSIMRCGRWA